jgi:hypothetical protein
MASYTDIMNARLNNARARQMAQQSIASNAQTNQNTSTSGFVRSGINPIAAFAMASKVANNQTIQNTNSQPNTMINQQTPINPQGFTNQNNINGIFGQTVPGTYNRQIGQTTPLMQTIDPLTGENVDPTMDQSASMPIPPPTGVQTQVSPVYDINNQ